MKKLLGASVAAASLLLGHGIAGAITNGTPDTDHKFVGALTGVDPGGTERLCSGSLIGEGVFLTAGHCMVLDDVVLHFGDDIGVAHDTFDAVEVVQHPDYTWAMSNSYDVGIVLFDQDVDLGAPGEVAPEDYIDGFTKDELKSFTFSTLGYGLVRNDANGNSAPLVLESERRIGYQSYLNDHNQYLTLSIHTNKGSGGGCFGDSGGPHLLEDPTDDSKNYIVSITSAGDGNCVATDATQRVDQPEIRDWIECVKANQADPTLCG